MKIAAASAIFMRPDDVSGTAADGGMTGLPSQEFAFSNAAATALASSPGGFARLLAVELPGERAGKMDQAAALLPSAPPLFKLAGKGILARPAFAFRAVPTLDLKRHTA